MEMIFLGFPAAPSELSDSIEAGIKNYRNRQAAKRLLPWTELYGEAVHLVDSIRAAVKDSARCIFDITVPNANVFFEIGLAAGLGKPITLLVNSGIKDAMASQAALGIFDTQRLKLYLNGADVANLIDQSTDPYYTAESAGELKNEAPVYYQRLQSKIEFDTVYLTSIGALGLHHREHDPEEDWRLPLSRAHREVAASAGVYLSLLPDHIVGSESHNLRAYLLAGLCDGLGVPHLILRYGDFIAPFDLRDDIVPVSDLDGIVGHVDEFHKKVLEAFQAYRAPKRRISTSNLTRLSVGASTAENEFRRLETYFVETREYYRALRGEAQLVVGRKGTGKTAIFWQIAEKLKSNRANLVLDLRPDGFHLRKLNELIAANFSEATHSHTMTAFWEYVLLLEMAHRVLEDDEFMIGRDRRLETPYRHLESIYEDWDSSREGDFPERLLRLIKRLQTDLSSYVEEGQRIILTTPQITEIVFKNDIRRLRDAVLQYLEFKTQTSILVDNLDKGWNATGVTNADTMLVQALIDAGRKLQRDGLKRDVEITFCIFLRDDVYEFLIANANDRGKETAIKITWTDDTPLLTLLNQRLSASSAELGLPKSLQWADIAVPYIGGEKSFSFLARHAMHRPRALIDIVELAISIAAQAGHQLLTADDIQKAVESYSVELLQGINFEIADIFPAAARVVYSFVGTEDKFDPERAAAKLAEYIGDDGDVQRLFDILLWFGFFGVQNAKGKDVFIFDVGENLDLLKGQAQGTEHPKVVLHPMFRLALQRHAAA